MTKKTPGWSNGLTPAKRVEGAPAKGHANAPTPHFIPEKPLGKPKAGVDPTGNTKKV